MEIEYVTNNISISNKMAIKCYNVHTFYVINFQMRHLTVQKKGSTI